MSQHSEQHETFLKIIGEHSPLIYKVCYMYAGVSAYPDCPDEEAYSLADRNDEHAELLREMYGMISQLGKLDRAIIMLWLDEYSYEEIAQLTGLSRNNVASRLHRAKERLATTET